ncbi:MAG: hypothetical protein AAF307_09360 [Pseudomonadota bacterium]
MNILRVVIVIAALLILGACAQSSKYTSAPTRHAPAPLPFLQASDADVPTMSMAEIYEETQAGPTPELIPELDRPQWHTPDASTGPATGVSARSTFSLL